MAKGRTTLRVLVVQRWTRGLEPLAHALRSAGVDAGLKCVDFEAALHAALVHERFDVAIYAPDTVGLSREQVETCLRMHGREIPLIDFGELDTIGERVAALIAPRRN